MAEEEAVRVNGMVLGDALLMKQILGMVFIGCIKSVSFLWRAQAE